MHMDDMILLSIDDHVIEPPDMYKNHVPAKWLDSVPKVVRNEAGVDEWVFQGEKTSTPFGMAATVGWHREEWGFNPGAFTELRPGCFEVHQRVRDMNANGVLASMCFPTMAGFNARTFSEALDKDLSLIMLQAYNDWHIDEWCGAYPGRFIPLGIVPMWDVELAVKEIRRIAAKGCRSISFLEAPHAQGWPSFLSGHWDPMLQALVDENMVLSLHIGGAWDIVKLAPEVPIDHMIVIPSQLTMLTAQDLLFGPTLRRFPELKVALSEGGIGWIPFYLDRVDRHFQNQSWIHNDFGGKLPSEVFREHFLACYITDPAGLRLREQIGIETIAWECDYPHTDTTWPESPEHAWNELQQAGCRDDEIHQITWENASRFFGWDPFSHTPREQATVGALRGLAADVDVTRMSREEWRKRNEAAGIGVF
ncbi:MULTISPECIES: amidohydrolase family protein [Parafrankia]|uniref:Amidohydrolase n=1 Tax=Parafrankia soli TaxID=2599596 RepID=A0A1S1RKV2_9ACTN|nr:MULTISPECIES: amidohydrolase family protein [Parafrankia]ABW10173.1 amidohydrolase 2 [Frankia sp. EAN1pec]CAI7980647.1 Amidohydrolase 2 [Frankia sp. Hr75.2]OHV46716.1 amidohydrolase [Parafrankia soli]TCJ31840.1 amidohydrolase [Parafrankia sp. BMG5.11]SQD94713.1 Amidohydrolase 2 [Parafrankia sp. Ea1.12]